MPTFNHLIVDENKDLSGLRDISLSGKINFFNSTITPAATGGIPIIKINYSGYDNYHEFYDRYFSHFVNNDFGGYREYCASSSASHYNGFFINRAGGTLGSYAATPILANLGQFVFRGHDGSAFTGDVAALRATSTENATAYTSTARGAKLAFLSTAQGTTTLTESVVCHGPRVGINLGGSLPGSPLDINGDTVRLRTSRSISTATSIGSAGEECWDTNYLYRCTATNTWIRIPHPTTGTPAQVTSDTNNYAPTNAFHWRMSTDASRNVTGINVSQWGGDTHVITNVGSNNIVFKHQDTNSTAAYRFISVTGADITLAADEILYMIYDSSSLRWRIRKG